MKPGRNDPCPCGSQKKYKQCCGALQAAPAPLMPAIASSIAELLRAAQLAHQQGNFPDAQMGYQKILQVAPNNPDALHMLGLIACQNGDPVRGAELIAQAIHEKPTAFMHYNLGVACQQLGRLEAAIANYQGAVQLRADYFDSYNNMGNVLHDLGRIDDALAAYRSALAIRPDHPQGLYNLAVVMQTLENFNEAELIYRRVLVLQPDFEAAHYNLANALRDQGKFDAAIDQYLHALTLNPADVEVLCNWGGALREQGKLDEAIEMYRRALAIDQSYAMAHGNLLFCLNYHPTLSAEDIYAEYKQWNAQHAAVLIAQTSFVNQPDPRKRLRVGYVSPDFCNHSVIHFAAPLIELADKSQFEIFCYYNGTKIDEYTLRVREASDHFILCKGMTDVDLVQRIRDDGIDVLVDLAGHTAGNRLLVFARRAAPVQVTCFGFGYTTGLKAMDYFIGDPIFTPPEAQKLFSETLVPLPHCFAAYTVPDAAPSITVLPALENAFVTFACLSRAERINDDVIKVWAEILRQLPDARLRLDSRSFRESSRCLEIKNKFLELGIDGERIQVGYSPSAWTVYSEVDIVLDCFPHNSGTTTYEALWMGLPVVTLAGRPSVGRIGASILTAAGRWEWIANNQAEYIQCALTLAQDIPALQKVRSTLRQAINESPLVDRLGFARETGHIYRQVWQRWCEQSGVATLD